VIPYERLQEVLVESPRLASDLAEVIEIRQRAVAKALEGGAAVAGIGGNPNHAADEKHTIGANITTLNQFVHNPHYSPQAGDLRTYWDNLQYFFEVAWPK
jgi:hypothetical protein